MPQTTTHPERRTGNRLAQETSPYLLQHAHNPVNWYPWGEGAFAAARELDKPIFLSIGYSTCYWCHVMERESFEDEATAALMNEHFVCIKVDREERPDVDAIYMTATQLVTGHGGWPMSVFLDPATLKPFLAGTYFPPEPRHGIASFKQVLEAVARAWREQRATVTEQAEAVAYAVTQQLASEVKPQLLQRTHVQTAVRQLMQSYDRQHGGFGGAPKFPQPVFLELLMGSAWNDEAARNAVIHTLERMATGGMYDQLGGGFHRYSTDREWIVPHFEKMLYDNGQLLSVYAEAYERTRNPLIEKVARETAEYVLREMQSSPAESGGFYSAQDAEVDAREGLSYLWTADEVKQALIEAGLEHDLEFALETFGLSRGANFTDPHFPEDGPKNVLVLTDVRAAMNSEQFKRVQQAMLKFRGKRKQPHLDDKILAGWNGLMIAGLADAGRVLGEQRWKDAAAQAAMFVLGRMQHAELGLLRVARGDRAKVAAFFEDYAFMIRGLLALRKATGDDDWSMRAESLLAEANRRFWDIKHGGYFETLANQPDLFVRTKSFYDGAVPSGNSVMALNLLAMYTRTGKHEYLGRAGEILRAASQQMSVGPSSCSLSVLALDRLLANSGDRATNAGNAAEDAAEQYRVVVAEIENFSRDGASVNFDVKLRIRPGYHINAHNPGDQRLIGLAIEAVDASGGAVEARIDYPEGEPLDEESELGAAIKIHHGDVAIPVSVPSSAATIRVRFQPCSDVACLAPQSIELVIE